MQFVSIDGTDSKTMYKLKSQLPLNKLMFIYYSGPRKKVCEQLYQVSLTIDIDMIGKTKSYFANYDILTIKM